LILRLKEASATLVDKALLGKLSNLLVKYTIYEVDTCRGRVVLSDVNPLVEGYLYRN
jgi:hypothetical protein